MRNLTMMTDLYQLTMMNAYLKMGMADREAVFDVFYRSAPGLEFAVAAGLEQAVEYINNLHFTEEEIEYLKSLALFDEAFFDRLRKFRFTGDIFAVREGEIVFPTEPILTVRAPLFEAQLVETALLNIINHQTLIATKALKITQETTGAVSEFGLRRAQGPDAGIYGSRASMIGGCTSTSNVLAGQLFDVRISGTHAHSWVMSFPTELEAFRHYAEIYPENCLLLVDTYNTLKSGVPNAIKVFDELSAKGYRPVGIRLDSGDLAYLSREARRMLDEAGHKDCKIFVSNDIDENVLLSLGAQQAAIDVYGIGTKLITSFHNASLGGVYKLCAIEENGRMVPRCKVSDSHEKTTNPGLKKIVRIYKDGMAEADLICLENETINTDEPLTIFHPEHTYKRKTFRRFEIKELLVDVFKDGKLVYDLPSLEDIGRNYDRSSAEFFPEYKRVVNTQYYKVDLSEKLWTLRNELLTEEHR